MSSLATTPRKPLRAGYRLDGRYELLFPYAQGGMATVWLARVQGKHGFEKLYAVKTILPHLAADAAFRSMFLDEARIASRIRHPSVAEIEDLGEDDGHLYMVLEWVQGDAWSKLVTAVEESREPTPFDLMLRIAADTCAGLHAAHELKDDLGRSLDVVHRDVSPQNVIVTEGGAVKVIDFGVAKAVGRASEATRTGLIKGKVEYLSPELALGRGGVDRRVDIWALGATLYEIFAGQLPFTGKTDLDVLRAISSGKPPPPLPPRVPASAARVVMAALHPDRDRRVPTALDLQRQLEAAMSSTVTTDDVAHAVRHFLKSSIRSRHESIAVALRDAAARAMATGALRSAGHADVAPGSFPTRPPEASPVHSPSIVVLTRSEDVGAGMDATVVAEPITVPNEPPAGTPELPVRLRPLHAVWLVFATVVTLGVWSTVVARALASR